MFHSLISVLYRIIETDGNITTINLQINKVDVPVICKNYECMVRDVEKVNIAQKWMTNRFEKRMRCCDNV